MELTSVRIEDSPHDRGRARLIGDVIYDDQPGISEEYWFEVPGAYAGSLSTTGNPWAVCLLPLAMSLGEPLRLSLPVDGTLLENLREVMRLWKYWYSHLEVVPVKADVLSEGRTVAQGAEHPVWKARLDKMRLADVGEGARKTAAFFSGGVDSFFTVLHHGEASRAGDVLPIDELLTVWGFDVPLSKSVEFGRMLASLRHVAEDLQTDLIDIRTNLRETRLEKRVDWAQLNYGCALASVALALEKRYRRVLIASCWGYKDLRPWGSHPLTDPLFSTSQLRLVYHGAAFDRVQKTEFIARFDVAMRALRVCWREGADYNCCACNKCYRTMAALEVLGVLDRCTSFAAGTFDLAKLARVYCPDDGSSFFFREVQELALRKGRRDVAKAIEASFRYSRMLNRLIPLSKSIEHMRFLWRLKEPLERMMGQAIT
jgi:hypothetical protein